VHTVRSFRPRRHAGGLNDGELRDVGLVEPRDLHEAVGDSPDPAGAQGARSRRPIFRRLVQDRDYIGVPPGGGKSFVGETRIEGRWFRLRHGRKKRMRLREEAHPGSRPLRTEKALGVHPCRALTSFSAQRRSAIERTKARATSAEIAVERRGGRRPAPPSRREKRCGSRESGSGSPGAASAAQVAPAARFTAYAVFGVQIPAGRRRLGASRPPFVGCASSALVPSDVWFSPMRLVGVGRGATVRSARRGKGLGKPKRRITPKRGQFPCSPKLSVCGRCRNLSQKSNAAGNNALRKFRSLKARAVPQEDPKARAVPPLRPQNAVSSPTPLDVTRAVPRESRNRPLPLGAKARAVPRGRT